MEQNDHVLFIGWYDYALVTNTMPIEAQVHQASYIALHPDKLAAHFPPELHDDTFPGLRGKSRPEEKRMLNEVIERYRSDRFVMNHPGTERTALIMNWEQG